MYKIFSDETGENLDSVMKKLCAEMVSDPGEMLVILNESKAAGTMVGILAQSLGNEIHVTAVEDIIVGDDVTVILKNYDITGYMLETNKLKLGDIISVCPFTSTFENPFMRALKLSKSL